MPAFYEIESLGGNCPVQAEGVVAGKRFYFRARWQSWSVSVYGREEDFLSPDWYYEEPFADLGADAAGWMTEADARAFLDKALNLYLAGEASA